MSAMVTPTIPPIPTRAVVATSAFETKKIMYADMAASGTRKAMDTITTCITSAVIRNIWKVRGGESASSSRRKRQKFDRGAAHLGRLAVIRTDVAFSFAIMMDDRDR